MERIRVLVVDDSLVFREFLVQNLKAVPDIEVVGVAKDPFEARDAIVALHPDVMTLDIELPRMDGIEFLRKLMPQYPMPVVVISALSDRVFDALNAGAVDFVAKPNQANRQELQYFIKNELPNQIRIAKKATIQRKIKGNMPVSKKIGHIGKSPGECIIAIGASTGGTEAIATVLKGFDADMPGTLVVQHMPPGFTGMYAKRLNDQCRMEVREAKNGDVLRQGLVLLAPGGDAHMSLIRNADCYQVTLKQSPKVNGHCPSVDVMFQSVAKCAGARALGILLTGMGNDGAKGLLAMRRAGAHTIGQNEESCVVYGMPRAAYELGAVEFQVSLSEIANKTYQVINKCYMN